MDDLTSEFDVAWKEALDGFFGSFFAFFVPPIHAAIDWSREPEFLDKELQQVMPEAEAGRGTVDKLAKVWTPDGEEAWVLVHIEVQSQHEPEFAGRMFRYNYRLFDRYGRMPVSVAVLGDDSRSWRPDAHVAGRWGCEVRFTYPTVRLLDYTAREAELEADPNPFAAVTLAHLKTIETRGDPDARRDWLFRLARGLFDRGYNRVQIQQLLWVMTWMMKLPGPQRLEFKQNLEAFEEARQMPRRLHPFEQDALEEGMTKGLYRGIAAVLRLRFGQPGADLMPLVKTIISPSMLEGLIEEIETAPDLAAVRAMLPPG